MQITILGSGTGVPTAMRQPAGLVIQHNGQLLLMDSGSGTLASLVRSGLDYRALDILLYTHAHADHTLDLAAIVHALNFTPGYDRRTPLRVIGPSGFSAFVERFLSAYPSLEFRNYPVVVEELDGAQENLGWALLASAAVPHGNVPANAYRLETPDGVVAFSGDCSPSQALVEIAQGADLMFSEASFPVPVPEGEHHLTTSEAARIAQEAGAKVLVLTHFYPWSEDYDAKEESSRYFSGRIIAAEDNLVLDLQAGEVTALWDKVEGTR